MGTIDAFQRLVWSPQFKQNYFPHRSKMGVLKSFPKICRGFWRFSFFFDFWTQFKIPERQRVGGASKTGVNLSMSCCDRSALREKPFLFRARAHVTDCPSQAGAAQSGWIRGERQSCYATLSTEAALFALRSRI